MSIQSFTISSGTFNQNAAGIYVKSDLLFGAPANEFRVRPNSNAKSPSSTIVRYKQFLSSDTIPRRFGATVTLSYSIPAGQSTITPTNISEMVGDVAALATEARINAFLLGG